jgi:hypothetical protein
VKFRFIVPAIFVVLAGGLFFFFALGAGGHGDNPFGFVLYLMFPVCFLVGLVTYLGVPELLTLLLCVLGSVLQYFFIGYLIDIAVRKHRQKKRPQS